MSTPENKEIFSQLLSFKKRIRELDNKNSVKCFLSELLNYKKEILRIKEALGPSFIPLIGKVKTLQEQAKRLYSKKEEYRVRDFFPHSTMFNEQSFSKLEWFIEQVSSFMREQAYVFVDSPDLDSAVYVFDKLGITLDHTARSHKDTFYVHDESVLRTHTTVINTHFLYKARKAIALGGVFKMFTVGTVYRRDSDATHLPSFHQMELLCMEKDASISRLFAFLAQFLSFLSIRVKEILMKRNDESPKFRFRPHFFPYTLPSFEMDIMCCSDTQCILCGGNG